MKRFLFALGLLLSTAVLAETEKEGLVNDVLEASNIKISLAAIPNQLAQLPAMLPDMQSKTPQKQQAFMQSFAEALFNKFDEAKALDAVTEHFVNQGDSAKLKEIRDWLTSATGKSITQQEILKQTGDLSGMQDFMTAFSPDSIPTARRVILQQFINGMNMTNRIGEMTETMVPSLIRSFGAAKGESAEDIEAEIMRFADELAPQIDAFQAQMKPQMDLQMLASMAYLYGDVSDEELEAYTAFIKSEAGQHFLDLTMDSVMAYSVSWISAVLPELLSELEQ